MQQKPKPIRRPKIGVRSIWRIPDDGPVIPRLQRKDGVAAIGFHHHAIAARDDDE